MMQRRVIDMEKARLQALAQVKEKRHA